MDEAALLFNLVSPGLEQLGVHLGFFGFRLVLGVRFVGELGLKRSAVVEAANLLNTDQPRDVVAKPRVIEQRDGQIHGFWLEVGDQRVTFAVPVLVGVYFDFRIP